MQLRNGGSILVYSIGFELFQLLLCNNVIEFWGGGGSSAMSKNEVPVKKIEKQYDFGIKSPNYRDTLCKSKVTGANSWKNYVGNAKSS